MATLVALLTDAFHRPATRVYQRTQRVVDGLIALSVALVTLEVALPGPWVDSAWVWWIDHIVLALFAFELVARIATWQPPELAFFSQPPLSRLRTHVEGRLRYLLQPLQLIDLLTLLALVPALRGLRALRLLRLLRTRVIFRYSNPFAGLLRAFEENKALFIFGQSLLGLATVVGGLSIYLVERRHNPAMQDLGDGLWWAIVTLTTVGFGDIAPVTGMGRIIGAFLMVAGMFLLALFAGLVGHTLLYAVLGMREEQYRMSSAIGHVIIMGYDAGSSMLLEAIERELATNRTEIVIMADRVRPPDIPPRFTWVQGDPTRESELDKVRLTHASKVVVVAPRSDRPQHADAVTLLTLFTLRRYLSLRPETAHRLHDLYVVAEILDRENVEHATAAGADEVIETTRLGYSLIAHAITQPGTGAVLADVAAAGAHSLYVGRWRPAEGPLPATFGGCQRAIKATTGALVIGLRGADGVDRLNPAEDAPIDDACSFLYLAERPFRSA